MFKLLKLQYNKNQKQLNFILISAFSQVLNLFIVLYYVNRTSVEDISMLTKLTSISSMLLSVLFWRLDIFIVIEKNIFRFTRFLSYLIIIFIIFVLFLLINIYCFNIFNIHINVDVLFFFVFSFSVIGLVQFFNAIANHFKFYYIIGLNSLISVIFSGFYLLQFDIISLITILKSIFYSQLLISILNLFYFNRVIFLSLKKMKNMNFVTFKSDYDRAKMYLILSTPMTFLNSYILQFPVFFLSSLGNTILVYYYFLFSKFVMAPLSLISNPVSQILLKEFTTMTYKEILFRSKNFFVLMLKFSPLVIILFILFIYILSYFFKINGLLDFLIITSFLIPVYLIVYFISALSGVIPTTGKIEYESYWKLPSAILIYFICNLNLSFSNSIFTPFIFLSIVILTIYFFYFYLIRKLLISK